MGKIKVVIAGPSRGGKSTLANALVDESSSESIYIPTVGTRIIEVVRTSKLVEVWEIPGDLSFQHLWPVLLEGAVATIFVYSTDQRKDLDHYLGLPVKNALVIQTGKKASNDIPIPGTLGPFRVESPADFRAMFDDWIANYAN